LNKYFFSYLLITFAIYVKHLNDSLKYCKIKLNKKTYLSNTQVGTYI